jgi:hypothetical protein
MANPDQQYFAQDPDRPVYWEKSKNFLPGAGITVRGETDENGKQIYEYFFPHFHGEHVSFTDTVDLEKEFEREEYKGVCELPDMGIMMVFHMNRMKDYAARVRDFGYLEEASVRLSALSIRGSILLPLARKQTAGKGKEAQAAAMGQRKEESHQGSPEALAEMAMQELFLFNMISNRLMDGEDVLSIVNAFSAVSKA